MPQLSILTSKIHLEISQVPKQISVPSPPRFVKKCDTVTETREQCRTIYVDKTEEIPIKTCNNVLVEKCEPYSVPNTEVVSDPKEGTQTGPQGSQRGLRGLQDTHHNESAHRSNVAQMALRDARST